jgi:hypothetical protein
MRNGFTAYSALSPVTGFLATVAMRISRSIRLDRCATTQLDASIGASGPHDFAVRISRARQSQLSRPPHPTTRFVTLRNAPLLG